MPSSPALNSMTCGSRMPLRRPWATLNEPPMAWERLCTMPSPEFWKAIPAIVAPVCWCVRAFTSWLLR